MAGQFSAFAGNPTVYIPQSSVKKQSIGNCWLYAALGWLESLSLSASKHFGYRHYNFSESYLTYRHFEEQLMDRSSGLKKSREITTGGSFEKALDLIHYYGLMAEGDFIPDEAYSDRSEAQSDAVAYLNNSLELGKLANIFKRKTSEEEKAQLIQSELDEAFGVDMNALEGKIIDSESVLVGWDRYDSGRQVSLYQLSNEDRYRWSDVHYPNYASDSQKEKVLRRVKSALNDGHPVMISWFVDFNANEDGVFSRATLDDMGAPGRQGGHLTVIADYTASGESMAMVIDLRLVRAKFLSQTR